MLTKTPIVGAAMTVPYLETYQEWLNEKPRDLELQDFFKADVLDGHWQSLVEKAKPLLQNFQGRIGIHGPFLGFSLSTPDLEVQTIVKKRLDQGLEVCEALNATHMVVHSPYTIWYHNNRDNRDKTKDYLIENCHLTMRDAVKRAEDIGCQLVVENIEDIDPYARLELINSFNSTALGISIDTGHAHYMHCCYGAPPVDYFVKAAGEKLAHMHIQDVDGYADRHWVPGEGTISWHEVFRAMVKFEAKPRLIIELADLTRIKDAEDWLISQGLAQ